MINGAFVMHVPVSGRARQVSWLDSCALWYWGDIDIEGLTILSRLRSLFPQTRSLLMDGETLSRWRDSLTFRAMAASWACRQG